MPSTRTAHARPTLAPLERRPLTARVDHEGRYREASAGYAALFGARPAALRGRRTRDVVGRAYWAAVRPYVERALRGETVSFQETLPVEGGERVLEAHYVPDAGGFTALLFDRTRERRDESAFAALFAQAGDGIVELDLRGRLVRVNDRYCELVGRRRADVVGKLARDLTYPGDAFLDAPAIARLAKSGGRLVLEKRLLRADGSGLWATVSYSVLRGEGGRPVGAMGVVHDLTARRRAREELRQSEQRYRALGASSPIGIFAGDAEGRRTYANPRLLEIFGYAPGEQDDGPMGWAKRVHPEDRDRLMAARAAARQKGAELVIEYRVVHPAGAVRWVRARSRPMRDEAGRYLGHTGTIEDVTQRRVEELERQALFSQVHEERRRLSDIFDNLPALVWETRGVKPEELQVTYISPYASALTGVPVKEYLTTKGLGLAMIHPEDRPAAAEALRRSLASGKPARYEFRMASRDGRTYWMEARSRPVLDAQGRVAGTRGVALDISARKQAEEAVRRGEEAQREFIANVSHDFRTPLASIKGFAETLLRREADRPTRRLFTRTILKNAQRLTDLVEDVLTLSSVESGAQRAEPEAVDLAAFVLELSGELAPVLRSRRVTLTRAVPRGLSARFDRCQLAQVTQNLIGNAARYNRPGGWIRVSARRAGRFVEVCVADNGVGIAAEHLPRVFDRFYRVDRVRSSAAKASGLGLHIVKRLVEAAGGRVWAESAPGRGSRFYFTAPLVE